MIPKEYLVPVFKASPLPSLLLIPDAPRFTIAEVNTAYLEVTGFKAEELVGKGVFEAFPDNPDALGKDLKASLHRVLQTGLPHKMAAQRYDLPDKATGAPQARHWKPENFPVLVEQEVVCILHTVKDITAEICRETELKDKARLVTARFENLVQTIDGIFWEADAQTFEFSYISPQVERILGYTPEMWKNEPGFWQKHIYPGDREEAVSFCHSMTGERKDHRFEYRMIAADGSLVWLHDIVSVIAVEGEAPLLRGIMVDISHSKQAAEILKASEKRYELLFQTSPLSKWIYDIDTFRILDVNETAILHYGYSRAEFLDMSINALQCGDDSPGLFEAVFYAKKYAQMFSRGVHRHVKKNGDIIHVEIQKNIIDFNGCKAALILSTDVTDRVRSIMAIEEQNQRLEEIAFLQSHIVRAPLARMMGIINLFKDMDNSPEEFRELVTYFVASGKELDTILRDIIVKAQPTDIAAVSGPQYAEPGP